MVRQTMTEKERFTNSTFWLCETQWFKLFPWHVFENSHQVVIFALYKENFALLEYTGLFMLCLCVYTDLNSQSSSHGHIFIDQTN